MKKLLFLFVIFSQTLFSQNSSIWIGYNYFLFTPKEIEKQSTYSYNLILNDSFTINTKETAISQYKTVLKNRLGLNFGYNKKYKLNDKFAIQYGIGLNYQSYNYDISSRIISFQTQYLDTSKITPISGGNFTKTPKFLRYAPNQNFAIEIQNLDLILPLYFDYHLNNNFSLSGGVELWTGIFAQKKEKDYIYYRVSETDKEIVYDYRLDEKIENNTSSVARFGISLLGQLKYKIINKHTISVGSSFRLNSQYCLKTSLNIYQQELCYKTISPFVRYYYSF